MSSLFVADSPTKTAIRSPGPENTEVALLREQVALLESEMEALRRRMKLLEGRAGEPIENLPREAVSTVPESIRKRYENPHAPESPPAQTARTAATTQDAHSRSPQTSHTRHRRRSSTQGQSSSEEHPKRTGRSRRRSRGSKIKRQLLFGYGLLIGTALLVVLVLMIFNLFGTEPVFSGGAITGTSDPAEVNIEIDDKPDLDELRQAIENAE